MLEDLGDRVAGRQTPFQLSAIRPAVRPDAEADALGEQVAEHLADGAQPVELIEHHPNAQAGLFIGVEFVPALLRADIPDRRSLEDLPASDLVQQPLPHPPAQDV